MNIKILFIGDVYGRCGRNALKKYIPLIKEKHKLDLIIANGENSTNGKGMSYKVYKEMMEDGVDAFTLGNHFLDKDEILTWIDKTNNIARPANLDFNCKGVGSVVIETPKGRVRISNLLGQVLMKNFKLKNPFDTLKEIIKQSEEKIHIVDFHAETTSEKKSLGYFVDGKVSAVVGTHTHIQTADEKIFKKGTAYISDIGFCGAYESVLGVNIEGAIEFCKDGYSKNTSPAMGDEELNGVIIDIDVETGMAVNIQRVILNPFKQEGI